MATQMTNTVPGIVTFRSPIAMHINRVDGGGGSDASTVEMVVAVKGTWTTNATGTDGKITVTDILPVNEDQFVTLRSSVTVDVGGLNSNSTNITAIA